MIPHRLINIALRGMTLGSKFLLIFFLARFLEPAELGLYGLLVATIGYALYLLGLDFYTYSTREILKRERSEWGGLLKNQGALTLVLYALFIPLLLLIFVAGTLPWYLAFWFFVLLVLEHLNQELMRLLIAISDQLMASVVLFLRSGAWAVAVVLLMFIQPEMRTLQTILGAWTLGGLLAVLLAVWRLGRLRISGWHTSVNWGWILNGVKVALPLLGASLAMRGLFTLDRYWIEQVSGLDVLGAYVFFISIANAMSSFLEAGVFSFLYPGLVQMYQQGDFHGFRKGMKKLLIQTLCGVMLFSFFALLMVDPLLNWVDRPLYNQYGFIFPFVLLALAINSLGMVPHFGLYAQKRDGVIAYSHVVGFFVFMFSSYLFSKFYALLAIPVGLCVSLFIVGSWKYFAYLSANHKR